MLVKADYYHLAAKRYPVIFCIQSKPPLSAYSMIAKLPWHVKDFPILTNTPYISIDFGQSECKILS